MEIDERKSTIDFMKEIEGEHYYDKTEQKLLDDITERLDLTVSIAEKMQQTVYLTYFMNDVLQQLREDYRRRYNEQALEYIVDMMAYTKSFETFKQMLIKRIDGKYPPNVLMI